MEMHRFTKNVKLLARDLDMNQCKHIRGDTGLISLLTHILQVVMSLGSTDSIFAMQIMYNYDTGQWF